MPRERSLSGTIPSMETAHDELKDNTIIIGMYPMPYLFYGIGLLVHLLRSPRRVW